MATTIGNMEDILFFPYNSIRDEFNLDDRLYDAQDWADYFRQIIGNGVYPNPSNGLKVESLYGSMVLTVHIGSAFANGRFYLQKKVFEFSVSPAHLTLGRRDIVVCRHDAINRTMQVIYIQGTPSSLPLTPSIIRTDDIFDLQLCEITINPNALSITQANILDTRLNSAVCGIVHGIVDQVDTTDIFNQYESFLNQQIALWNDIRNTQQETWEKQTEQQEIEWQEQTEQQEIDFNALHEEMTLTYHALETQSFTLINNNFDDWSVRRSTDKDTFFLPNGNIEETITIIALNFLMAKKTTEFLINGNIIETVTFYKSETFEGLRTILTTDVTMSKTTIFNADGSIKEEIR